MTKPTQSLPTALPATLFATLFAALSATACLPAQRLAAYTPGGITEVQPANPLVPFSAVLAGYPTVPALAPPAPGFVPAGDSTFASLAGLNLYTNGLVVTSTPTTSYVPAAPPLAPLTVPPALLATLGGPVTGMAYDGITGTLYLTGTGGMVVGISPSFGMPIVVPPFAIPFLHGPITGLEFDVMTGTFLAVDVTATVYPFFASGMPAGPKIVPAIPSPGMTGDVAIDKTGMLNAVGVRAIYVSVFDMYFDVTLPAPTFSPHGAGPSATGLAFQPTPAQSGPFGGCTCGGVTPVIGTTGAMAAGNAGFGMTLGSVSPGSLVLFGLDFGFDPAFPLFNFTGCGLGLIPGSPSLISTITFADVTGTATFPLPLTVLPGFGPIYSQALTLCPFDPAGFQVAPMQQIVASGW